ncbi:nicotinamidase-related amidase [Neorhizobium sp. 2083]|nr:nicotinamidase-related amidase [Neorhizobium sp. 2083]
MKSKPPRLRALAESRFTGPRSEEDVLSGNWVHLCIDMQRMFAEDTPWHVQWMAKVSPSIVEIAGRHPKKTIFTRFIPPVSPEQVPGIWQDY